ncbi:hypothetical protein ANRL2_04554 [Anaerolineae bacterium]|nr:hypothetical protein ANRL2_04554 [Anaerolineae bacterium]
MPRLNDIQFRYGDRGVQVVSVSYANTDAEIAAFISTYGARYGIARIQDDSGYTVPMFSWMFAIDRMGRLLWSGRNDTLTDAMIETWTSPPTFSDCDEEEPAKCTSAAPERAEQGTWLLALVFMVVVAVRAKQRFSNSENCR